MHNKTSTKQNKKTIAKGVVAAGAGAHLTKSPTSHSVINIVPPRHLWEQLLQPLRTIHIREARCGPHFSFIDPFVLPQHFDEAAQLLREELAHIQPFEVKFEKFNFFQHRRDVTLFLEPDIVPEGALDDLIERIVNIFPHCSNTIAKSKNGKFVPHLSIAKFANKDQMLKEMERLKRNFVPVSFIVKEIYMLFRKGGDPFEVKEVIPLGCGSLTAPHFGAGSLEDVSPMDYEDKDKIGRTLVVCGLKKDMTDAQLMQLFEDNRRLATSKGEDSFSPTKVEIILNPDGKPRPLGVVEFETRHQCERTLHSWSFLHRHPLEDEEGLDSQQQSQAYVLPLHMTVFPDVIGGTCSLHAVSSN